MDFFSVIRTNDSYTLIVPKNDTSNAKWISYSVALLASPLALHEK